MKGLCLPVVGEKMRLNMGVEYLPRWLTGDDVKNIK